MARNYVITTPSFCDLKLLKEECYIPFSDETATIMIDATEPLSPGLPDLNFVPIRVMKERNPLNLITRQKRPNSTVKCAPIKLYMGFADSFPPPTLNFLTPIN